MASVPREHTRLGAVDYWIGSAAFEFELVDVGFVNFEVEFGVVESVAEVVESLQRGTGAATLWQVEFLTCVWLLSEVEIAN